MTVNVGNHAYVIAVQTQKGTAATMSEANSFFMERLDGDIACAPEFGKVSTSDGSAWGGGRSYVNGVKMTSDTLTIVASPKVTPAIMAWCLGAAGVAGVGDPYTHTITPASTSPYVTIWRMVDGEWQMMKDCKIVDWEFLAANDGDEIIARISLKVVVLALPTYVTPAPAANVIPDRDLERYDFWHGTGAYKVDWGSGSEAVNNNISRIRIAPTRPTSAPKGDNIVPIDAFHGRGNIEVAYDFLATDHLPEFLHLYNDSTPANDAPLATVVKTGSVEFTLTHTAVNRILKFDVNSVEYRPENIVLVPDADGKEQYYRFIGDAQGTAPIMTVTAANAYATDLIA